MRMYGMMMIMMVFDVAPKDEIPIIQPFIFNAMDKTPKQSINFQLLYTTASEKV